MNLNYRKLEHTIVGTVDGKPFNIPNTKENIAALEVFEKDADEMEGIDVLGWAKSMRQQEVAGSNKYLLYNPTTGEYFLTIDGFRSKHPIPKSLVKFIEESFDKNIDFMPIIKAWARFLAGRFYTANTNNFFGNYLNAQWTDRDEAKKIEDELKCTSTQALNMATYQDIAITKEGLLATYKVADMVTWEYVMEWDADIANEDGSKGAYKKVRNTKYKIIPAKVDPLTGVETKAESLERPEFLEDYQFTPSICKSGDKFYSGDLLGYVYKIGEQQRLPKNALRNLNNSFGGGGLYTGGLSYIEGYHNPEGTKQNFVLCCFVDPGDIISFQDNGDAFRTDALLPNNVRDIDLPFEGSGIYHSSDYDKLSTERLETIMKDAVKRDIDVLEEQRVINDGREFGGVELKEDSND